MNRIIFSKMSLPLVLLTVLSLTVKVQRVEAIGTVYIRSDGSIEGTDKIQRSGKVYTFTDDIYDEIVVEISNVIIDGRGYTLQGTGTFRSKGVSLSNISNVTVVGINVRAFYYGVYLDSTSCCVIAGNNVTDNSFACILWHTSDDTVDGNNIVNNRNDGINVWDCSNNVISDNNISGNNHGIILSSCYRSNVTNNDMMNNFCGVSLQSSSNNTLRNNVLGNNFYGLEVIGYGSGDHLPYFIQDIDPSNTVNGKPVCYWVNHHNEQVELDAGYVALVNCTNITVKDLTLKNNAQGVVLVDTDNSRIQNLTITNNEHGTYLYRSHGNVICDTDVSNTHVGIFLVSSVENNIVHNTVTNAREGIFLSYSSYNNITDNSIAHNSVRGIMVGLSRKNNIAYNNVTDNMMAGIGISSDGKGTLEDNLVHHNNLINNTCGVRLGDTSGNKCYPNNFIKNRKQAEVHTSIGSRSWGNIWNSDYPSLGNYWSDHNPPDMNKDKIGDLHYAIEIDRSDTYPLIYPYEFYQPSFTPKPDINNDTTVNIIDVATVAKAFTCKPGDSNWNPLTDMDINEIIDIVDISKVAKDFGKTA